jgi:hypothetical protein
MRASLSLPVGADLLCFALPLPCLLSNSASKEVGAAAIYITHVTVIDTETEKEFRDRTVHISFTVTDKGTGAGSITGTMAFDRKAFGMNASVRYGPNFGPNLSYTPDPNCAAVRVEFIWIPCDESAFAFSIQCSVVPVAWGMWLQRTESASLI